MLEKLSENVMDKVSIDFLRNQVLRNAYGINITRVNRAGINLVASPSLRLQTGDKLTIVGEAKAIDNCGKILGNEAKELDNPNLIAIFIGLTLGLLLGSIPIMIPGMSMPIKLGLAGGPIIVGILIGAFGPRFHLTTYTTQSANLMLRQFGLVIYLAGLGLDAGKHFFETVFCMDGLNRDDCREVLQGGLCPQCRYALRVHGQPDGPELCQHYSERRRAFCGIRNSISSRDIPAGDHRAADTACISMSGPLMGGNIVLIVSH